MAAAADMMAAFSRRTYDSAPELVSRAQSCYGGCGTTKYNKWLYLKDYFGAHMLSYSSHRYAYLLWIVVAGVVLLVAGAHHLGIGDRTYIGAVWAKWATKDRVIKLGRKGDKANAWSKDWAANAGFSSTSADNYARAAGEPRRRHRPVFIFPSAGRMLMLFALLIVLAVFTLIGADYIRPSAGMFDMRESFPNATQRAEFIRTGGTVIFNRRDELVSALKQAPLEVSLHKRVQYGTQGYPTIRTAAAQMTIPYRTWWTAGGRTGLLTNALTPLIVIIALKQVPFALLSTRLLGQYAFDRLSFLHKWGGRVIWVMATLHVFTWSVQLGIDKRFTENIWSFVFYWTRFRWGFVSYGFLTLLVLLSVAPLRATHYEIFYVLHVGCVIGFMVAAWLHHPPLGGWMYATLLWWLLERITKTVRMAWVNGVFFKGRNPVAVAHLAQQYSQPDADGYEKSMGAHGGWARPGGPYPRPGSIASHHHSQPSVGGHSTTSSTLYNPSLTSGGVHGAKSGFASPHAGMMTASPPSYPAPLPDASRGFLNADSNASMMPRDGESGIDRRKTRVSRRYDPVSDVINDYSETGHGEPLPQPSQRGYTLEDSGPSVDVAMSSSQSGSTMHSGRPLSGKNGFTDGHAQGSMVPPLPPVQRAPRPALGGAEVAALTRPGYAMAQLLPGKTMRLTLRTPNRVTWLPGQYVNLVVPAVSWVQSHPFTVCSACEVLPPAAGSVAKDEELALSSRHGKAKRLGGGEERTMVLLIRARKGFTRHLWNHLVQERHRQLEAMGPAATKETTGVQLRALVDGPYGSTSRVRWGIHDTVLIICGGSGVTFGMAALEHLCSAMAAQLRRGGARTKGFEVRRVRFVWMLREFSHLQWVASSLRRCIEMIPPEMLQVDLFVTHYNNYSALALMPQGPAYGSRPGGGLSSPPGRIVGLPGSQHPGLATPGSGLEYPPSGPWATTPGGSGATTPRGGLGVPPFSQRERLTEGPEQEELGVEVNDLTEFDGEDHAAPTAAEMEINERIRKEGKLRRAHTRRVTMKRKGGRGGGAAGGQSAKARGGTADSSESSRTMFSEANQALASQRAVYEGQAMRLDGNSTPPYGGPPGIAENPFGSSALPEADIGQQGGDSLRTPFGASSSNGARRDPSPSSGRGLMPPQSHPLGQSSSGDSYGGAWSPMTGVTPPGSPGFAPRPHPNALQGSGGMEDGMSYDAMAPFHHHGHGPAGSFGVHSARHSTVNLLSGAAPLELTASGPHAGEEAPIDLDAAEDADLRVIAELARPGHPKLDRIIREESSGAKGRVLVASCGPSSLGQLLKSIVVKHIDPKRVRKGDLSAQINLQVESFEWGG